jgi:hypothetical protein
MVSTLSITYLHHSIFQEQSLHIIFEELYYIPLPFGALVFGFKGAFFNYLFVSASYLRYFFENWTTTVIGLVGRMLHPLFSGVIAFLIGFLVDPEMRYQKQSEKDKRLVERSL